MLKSSDSYANPVNFFGRDPSWLAFNERVLAQARRDDHPVYERLKFLSICGSNLDEYFMKRVARMKRRLIAGVENLSHDGKTVAEQYAASREHVMRVQRDMANCLQEDLTPQLLKSGIQVVAYKSLSKEKRRQLDAWFHTHAFPILTPLAVHRGHRFPFISNLSTNIGALVANPKDQVRLFARVKLPAALPSYVPVPRAKSSRQKRKFVLLEEIAVANLDEIFPGMNIVDVLTFRVTRSTGVDQEDGDGDDILESVEAALRRRRFAESVRLEVQPGASSAILDLLLDELGLDTTDVYERPGPLDYGSLAELTKDDSKRYSFKPWRPATPKRVGGGDRDIFAVIRERDLFVHHPYDSFGATVEQFIATAARDPQVLAIKQTLYRTTVDSPFVKSLIEAAQAGKQVACLVELRARFDEDRNVQLTRQLEQHGVHVTYGISGVKTHSKCSIVVRREGDGLQTYAHIGTGNYHPVTAQLYTDCGLLTCDPAITSDVASLFNYLTGRSLHRRYRKLIVAPVTMRERFNALIRREIENKKAGRPARIIAKFNQLEDIGIITWLYEASQAGVNITLFIRGFCCLRPRVKGLSENIRVISVIGRFLEHSRIFHFADGHEDPIDGLWYFGSADWMRRNIDERVEAITPIEDRAARRRLQRIFEVSLRDHRDAWDLRADGSYAQRSVAASLSEDSVEALGTFESLCRDALAVRLDDGESASFLTATVGADQGEGRTESPVIFARRCLRMLVARPWLLPTELAAAVGLDSKKVSGLKRRLEGQGLIRLHRLARHAIWEPTEEAVELVGAEAPPLEDTTPYRRRWLAARILASRLEWEPSNGIHDVESTGVRVDLAIGDDPQDREYFKFLGTPKEANQEVETLLDLPSGRLNLICFDAATAKKAKKVVSGWKASRRKSTSIQSAQDLIELTSASKKRTLKSKPKSRTR